MSEQAKYKWQIQKFYRGTRINFNDETDALYLILNGAIKVITYDLSGKVIILGYWGRGDVVGQCLTRIKPYEISCLTHVQVQVVPYQDWHSLSKEIRSCFQDEEQLLYILRQNSVEEKLLELLIFLGNKFGKTKGNTRVINLPLSHRELADFLGVTRVSITRAMNRLQTKKLVECPKRGLIALRTSEITRIKYQI